MEKIHQNNQKVERLDPGENKGEKPKIKEGVDLVFDLNPELVSIGTMEKYSEYLDTIFPESKLKDIFWHTTDNKFDFFDKDYIKDIVQGYGFYFSRKKLDKGTYKMAVLINSKNPIFVDKYGNEEAYMNTMYSLGERLLPFLKKDIKEKHPELFTGELRRSSIIELVELVRGVASEKQNYAESYTTRVASEILDLTNVSSYDDYTRTINSILEIDAYINDFNGDFPEIVISEPDQIHILGTPLDKDAFKKFINCQINNSDPHASV